MLIAIATHLNWPIHQLDVLTAFLNGILEENVYMHQPLAFILRGAEHFVCKLHKSLYELRQIHAPGMHAFMPFFLPGILPNPILILTFILLM